MDRPERNLPWVSKTIHFDVETGEELDKKTVENKYIKLKKYVTTYRDGHVNVNRTEWACGRSTQIKLFE